MTGAEQFHLQVDVESLRAAQHGLQRLAEHLKGVATTTTRIPADIGDGWTGPGILPDRGLGVLGMGCFTISVVETAHER